MAIRPPMMPARDPETPRGPTRVPPALVPPLLLGILLAMIALVDALR